jgi:ribosomal-protein-alanine N-acetyltransferase
VNFPKPLPEIQIRPMQLDDLPAVIALDQSSFSLPWPESSFKYEVESNELSRCSVAEIQSPAGELTLVAMIVIWLIVDEAHVATIAVYPDYRRQKIAQRLLAHTLIDAYHTGAVKSFLEVRRGNQAAIRMYERFGFREVGIRKKYYQDNGEDAVLMDLDPLDLEHLLSLQ